MRKIRSSSMSAERKTIFVDTNILLDVLMRREEFVHPAFHLWQLCEMQFVEGYVSAISFNNIHYILTKVNTRRNANRAMSLILNSFHVVSTDERILRLATEMPGKDFEDAIQIHSARSCGASVIITRDRRHFSESQIPCMTPAQFLNLYA